MREAELQHFFRKRVIYVDARQRHFIFAVLFGKIQAVMMLAQPIALVNGNGNIISALNSRGIGIKSEPFAAFIKLLSQTL